MALFENYEGRMPQLQPVLDKYGFKSWEDLNYPEAFRAAHSLKGVCYNLGLNGLGDSASVLTDYLREKKPEEIDRVQCEVLLQKVTSDYRKVIDGIRQLNS